MKYNYVHVAYDNMIHAYQGVPEEVYKIKNEEELKFLIENYFNDDSMIFENRKYYRFNEESESKFNDLISYLDILHRLPYDQEGFTFATCYLSDEEYR